MAYTKPHHKLETEVIALRARVTELEAEHSVYFTKTNNTIGTLMISSNNLQSEYDDLLEASQGLLQERDALKDALHSSKESTAPEYLPEMGWFDDGYSDIFRLVPAYREGLPQYWIIAQKDDTNEDGEFIIHRFYNEHDAVTKFIELCEESTAPVLAHAKNRIHELNAQDASE